MLQHTLDVALKNLKITNRVFTKANLDYSDNIFEKLRIAGADMDHYATPLDGSSKSKCGRQMLCHFQELSYILLRFFVTER